MFIKLTVKHFLTLKPYCFWTFRSRDWIWPKQKGCQILCFFCFDLAGPSLEEKTRNNIYVPNLDRWTPLQNRHQPKVHILYFLEGVQKLFSWEVSCDMFVNFISVENLSKWPAYLWHAGGKMAKIQEVHGFIRFTDKKCMSKIFTTCLKYFEGPDLWPFWNVQIAPKYWFPCPSWVLAKMFGLRMLDLGP